MEDSLKIYNDIIKIANEEFKEEKHPRDEDGKFTSKGGGDSGSDYEEPKNDYDDIEEETIPKKNEYTELMDEKSLAEYEKAIKKENEGYGQIKNWKEEIKEAEDILEKIKGKDKLYYVDDWRKVEKDIESFYHFNDIDDYVDMSNLDKVRSNLKKIIDDRKESISIREEFYGVLYSGKHEEKTIQFEKTINDIIDKAGHIKVYDETDEEGEKPEWNYSWQKNDQNWIDMNKWEYEDWLKQTYSSITDSSISIMKKQFQLSDSELKKFDTDKRKRKYAVTRSKKLEKVLNEYTDWMKNELNKMIYVSKLRNK